MAEQRSVSRLASGRIIFIAALLAVLPAAADEVVVMTSGAFTAPFQDAAPWFERRTGHDVRMDRFDPPEDLPGGVALAAYRIVQEGLTNAVRHGAGPIELAIDLEGNIF